MENEQQRCSTFQLETRLDVLGKDRYLLVLSERFRQALSDHSEHVDDLAKELGNELFDSLANGDQLEALTRTAKQFSVAIPANQQGIVGLPWECLFIPDLGFVVEQQGCRLYREVVSCPPVSTRNIRPKILSFFADPDEGSDTVGLDLDAEQRQLAEAVLPLTHLGNAHLFLGTGSKAELIRLLSQANRFNLIFLCCHGVLNHRGGLTFLMGHPGQQEKVSSDELTGLLAGRCERLIISACQSLGSLSSHNKWFQPLFEHGLLEFVGMQAEVRDKQALIFSRKLFNTLTEGKSIAEALGTLRSKDSPMDSERWIPVHYCVNTPLKPMFPQRKETIQTSRPIQLAPILGRTQELSKMREILFDKGRSLQLVGFPGQGKSTIAKRLAVEAQLRGFDVRWVEGVHLKDLIGQENAAELTDIAEFQKLEKSKTDLRRSSQGQLLLIVENLGLALEDEWVAHGKWYKRLREVMEQRCKNLQLLLLTSNYIESIPGENFDTYYLGSIHRPALTKQLQQLLPHIRYPKIKEKDLNVELCGNPGWVEALKRFIEQEKDQAWPIFKTFQKEWLTRALTTRRKSLSVSAKRLLRAALAFSYPMPKAVFGIFQYQNWEQAFWELKQNLFLETFADQNGQPCYLLAPLARRWLESRGESPSQLSLKRATAYCGEIAKETSASTDFIEAAVQLALVSKQTKLADNLTLEILLPRYLSINQISYADKCLAKYFPNPPNQSLALRLKWLNSSGQIAFHLGNYKEAESYFLRMLEKSKAKIFFKQNFFARRNLAETYRVIGELKKAFTLAVDTIKDARKHPALMADMYLTLGKIYGDSGDTKRALRYLRKSATHVGTEGEERLILIQKSQIDVLIQIGELRKAMDLCNQVIDYADRTKLPFLEPHLSIAKSKILFGFGEFEKARIELKIVLKTCNNDKHLQGQCKGYLAEIYMAQGRYRLAERNYIQSLEIFKELGDQSSIAAATNNLGMFYSSWKPEEGLRLLKKALSMVKDFGLKKHESGLYSNIYNYYFLRGNFPEARRRNELDLKEARKSGLIIQELNLLYDRCALWQENREQSQKSIEDQLLEVARKAHHYGLHPLKNIILNHLAVLYLDIGQWEKSLSLLNKLIKEHKANRNMRDHALCILNESQVLDRIGKYQFAITRIKEALDISKQYIDLRFEGKCLNHLAQAKVKLKNNDDAINYFKKALEIHRRAHDLSGIVTTLNNIGNCFFIQERFDKAIRFFQEAEQVCLDIDAPLLTVTIKHNLASCQLAEGQVEVALKIFSEIFPHRKKIEDWDGYAATAMSLGDIFRERIKDYPLALSHYKQCFSTNRKLGRTGALANCHSKLAKTWEDLDFPKRAERHWQACIRNLRSTDLNFHLADALASLGSFYFGQGHLGHAKDCFMESYHLSKQLGLQNNLRDLAQALRQCGGEGAVSGLEPHPDGQRFSIIHRES